jgi:assimilatory nitrate reductase catalytic subunit
MRTHWGRDGEWIEYIDTGSECYRGAKIKGDRLLGCTFISPTFDLPTRSWLINLFNEKALSESQRRNLLTGRPPTGHVDNGDIVCSCFGVGRNKIIHAIGKQGLTTSEAVGKVLQAGTNCGSCISELKNLIKEGRSSAARVV